MLLRYGWKIEKQEGCYCLRHAVHNATFCACITPPYILLGQKDVDTGYYDPHTIQYWLQVDGKIEVLEMVQQSPNISFEKRMAICDAKTAIMSTDGHYVALLRGPDNKYYKVDSIGNNGKYITLMTNDVQYKSLYVPVFRETQKGLTPQEFGEAIKLAETRMTEAQKETSVKAYISAHPELSAWRKKLREKKGGKVLDVSISADLGVNNC